MKKNELKQLIREIVEEATNEGLFSRHQPEHPSHWEALDAALKHPTILKLRNKYNAQIDEDELNDLIAVVYGIAKYGKMDSHYL